MEEKNMEERILKAAEELFLGQGFAKTTTGQIAKSAGCNQALVHYYYRTKDNLFDRIFEQKARLLITNMLKVDTDEITPEEKVQKMVGMHFDFLKQNPRLVPFILNEIITDPDRLRSLADKLGQYPKSIFAQIEPQLKKESEQGRIRPISTMDLMLTIASLNLGPFLILPVVQKVTNLPDAAMEKILERRKQEVIETILARIRV